MQRVRSRVSARQAPTSNGIRSGLLVLAGAVAVVLAVTCARGAVGALAASLPDAGATEAAVSSQTPPGPVGAVGTYPPGYSGPIPEQPSPVPGVTPPPEPDPGYLAIPGVVLPTHSSLAVLSDRIGASSGGYTQVSFHLQLTLGADFGTRLDRSIRLLGPDNVRYLADEPAVTPSLLTETGYQLDGWVTFWLPDGMSGPALLQITVDPANLSEIHVPVVIGQAAPQPLGTFGPTTVIDQPTPMPQASAATSESPGLSPGDAPSVQPTAAPTGTVLP